MYIIPFLFFLLILLSSWGAFLTIVLAWSIRKAIRFNNSINRTYRLDPNIQFYTSPEER